MLKQFIAIIVLSAAVIMNMSYLQQGLHMVVAAHDWISSILLQVFSGDNAGNFLRKLLALLAIPLGVAFVPVVIIGLQDVNGFLISLKLFGLFG